EAESVHESAERVGEVSEAVARARLRGITEAGKVDREHRRAAGERTHVVSPGLGESTQAMHEDDRGPAAFDDIVQAEPVDFTSAKLQFRHGATILPDQTAPQVNRSSGVESAAAGRPRSRLMIRACFSLK